MLLVRNMILVSIAHDSTIVSCSETRLLCEKKRKKERKKERKREKKRERKRERKKKRKKNFSFVIIGGLW